MGKRWNRGDESCYFERRCLELGCRVCSCSQCGNTAAIAVLQHHHQGIPPSLAGMIPEYSSGDMGPRQVTNENWCHVVAG